MSVIFTHKEEGCGIMIQYKKGGRDYCDFVNFTKKPSKEWRTIEDPDILKNLGK